MMPGNRSCSVLWHKDNLVAEREAGTKLRWNFLHGFSKSFCARFECSMVESFEERFYQHRTVKLMLTRCYFELSLLFPRLCWSIWGSALLCTHDNIRRWLIAFLLPSIAACQRKNKIPASFIPRCSYFIPNCLANYKNRHLFLLTGE